MQKNCKCRIITSFDYIEMGNIKEINIKNRTYYIFDDMINITNIDPNLLKNRQKIVQKH